MLIGRALFPAQDDAGCAGAQLFGLRPGNRRRGDWLKRGVLRPKSVCRLLEPVLAERGATGQPDVRQGRTSGCEVLAASTRRRRKPVMSIEATAPDSVRSDSYY